MGFIYKITCIPTQQLYIGKTTTSIQNRWKNGHCYASKYPSHGDYNFPLHRAIRKYGEQSFIIEQIEEIPNDQLNEREMYWIDFYDSYKNGYNATYGGDGNLKYDYDAIVNYYLQHDFSLNDTCQHFGVYDQVVYSALKGKGIDYKALARPKTHTTHKKKIRLIEKDLVFNSMKEIDDYFGKQVHGNIRRCLNGTTKKAYGYTWEEIEDE